MSVNIKRTERGAEITWTAADDPHNYLARAIDGDQLAYALEALGGGENSPADAETALDAARHVFTMASRLERLATVQVVQLKDRHGYSWRQIATALYDDPERQSTVRRLYDSGRRHLGT
ncbi:hypothetical protein [Streptomyces sp. MN6]